MNLIPKSKIADCDRCGVKDTECRKRKKEYACLQCCKIEDNQKAIERASKRNALRKDGQKLRKDLGRGNNEVLKARQNLISDLDFYTSRIVRLMASDENGICTCYCCGYQDRWQEFDNAHFMGRSNLSLRFDITYNCRANCKTCNQYKNGNLEAYAKELKKEFGESIVEQLQERAREVSNISNSELSQMLVDYKQRWKTIQTKLII